MPSLQALLAVLLCFAVPTAALAAESQTGYAVTYSGGSLPNVKGGESLRLHIDSGRVRLNHKAEDILDIPARTITEVSYGEEVHHRIGTAAGLAVVSLGVGAIVAFSKSKKHYIGLTWTDGGNTGGIVLQADKNEYRGLLAALEGVSGKTAVEADSARTPGGHPQSAAHTAPASESEAPKTIIARFVSAPADAEVEIDGEYWGNTPTAESTRLQAGPHTIVVKKLGYEPWERKVTLVAGDNRTVSAELQPIANDAAKPGAPASVAIAAAAHENEIPKATVVRFTSTPASAEVSVDGEYWGTTPTADLSRFSPGSHTILVRKVGYEPWERKVTLAAGDDRTISAELKPNDASKPRISGLD